MEKINSGIINEFIRGINKGPLKCPPDFEGDDVHFNKDYKVNNKKLNDVYSCAVYQAWLDTCRTVSGAGLDAEKARESLANALQDYFSGDPKEKKADYDRWYYDSLMNDIKDKAGILSVGMMQKLINMSFKYLYCRKELREKANGKYFDFCHMPLDSYTLNWYKNEFPDEDEHIEKWSKINSINKYDDIVDKVRGIITDMRVLEAEFIIWQGEKYLGDLNESISVANRIISNKRSPKEIIDNLSKSIELLTLQATLIMQSLQIRKNN